MTDDEILDRMARHAVRRAHGFLPAQEIDDAVQTAMLRVWQRLPSLDPDRDPWPLLTRIVRQELAMYAREFYNRREAAHGDPLPAYREPEVRGVVDDISGPLRAVLEDLPDRWREAMVECVAEGRSKRVAGEVMGVSDSRVGALVRLGTSRMQERMAA